MTHVNAMLEKRLKQGEKSSKMEEMAQKSAKGSLTPFSGMFSTGELQTKEKDLLEALLQKYSTDAPHLTEDLQALITITSEIKAIHSQSALLHGERIKKAQNILKAYRDGAFTTWLITTYGNRQTPYNFLHYYEFYIAMPKPLRTQVNAMPQQVVYSLASREGPLEKKQEIIENYRGETKTEMLQRIRDTFPLAVEDKRKENIGNGVLKSLKRLMALVSRRQSRLTVAQKGEIFEQLEQLYHLVEQCKTG
ncbi:MAG: CT583 family protein [Waddliaceae bacterium]